MSKKPVSRLAAREARVTVRNARFQQWESYLNTRAKRTKSARFLIQGVRPLTLAIEHDWPLEALLYRIDGPPLSSWARGVLDGWQHEKVGVSGELMAELGEKDASPELIAVAKQRHRGLGSLALAGASPLLVVFDRPSSPGNLGTLIRSANAFGADAVIVAGHAADPYDPQCVRASTGSLFAVPVLTVSDADEVLAYRARVRDGGTELRIVGTDEDGDMAIFEHDFTGGTILVIGNETRGMSASWRAACDVTVSIPIGGAASSLGAPSAGAVCLYEIARQRG
ncbi:23S rRNA (uridine(2479)-2'-O)-methyltransferase [Rhodococcus sp. MTM3W5.2]|uniref:TrmH family RNA methyltransferase n=1 Tax=Rhodococcus sp. MTM3W5.2 TaxID=1805827 RepID=UPI00097912B8|nr:TrmH family RNA methyltransferase [Rhodococcus sp. MTM3W5.2]AQA23033.1 23S rRNA (uridine(2479)-2'-O)-methyltransferase [Rhodococcus sp. MTM3W5.2]